MAESYFEDSSWHLIFIIVIFLVLGYLVWYFFRGEILQILSYIRLAELGVLSLVDSEARACLTWLRTAPVGDNIPTADVYNAAVKCYGAETLRALPSAEALKYYNITTDSMSVMTTLAMRYLRWIGVLACLGVGIHAMFFSIRNKFKTRHTLESFIKTQVKTWPVIAPIVDFIPTKSNARIPGTTVPDKLPPFAEALSPEEWLSFHRIPVVNGIPDRDRVRKALLIQLGPRWQGLNNCPHYYRALFAAFALMGALKREECEEFMGKLAKNWSPSKNLVLDEKLTAEVNKLLKDPAIGGKALEIANNYAYRTTAMLGILKWARFQGGVLAPAAFLWLRGQDRNLWYPLNNLGRRSFHTEGAGAIAHFMAEEAAGKPLPIPRIDTAIVTINQYLAANPGIKIPPREGAKLIERKTNA